MGDSAVDWKDSRLWNKKRSHHSRTGFNFFTWREEIICLFYSITWYWFRGWVGENKRVWTREGQATSCKRTWRASGGQNYWKREITLAVTYVNLKDTQVGSGLDTGLEGHVQKVILKNPWKKRTRLNHPPKKPKAISFLTERSGKKGNFLPLAFIFFFFQMLIVTGYTLNEFWLRYAHGQIQVLWGLKTMGAPFQ